MTDITGTTAKTAKNLAQAAAKKIAQEPFEILGTAKKQIGGEVVSENVPDLAPQEAPQTEKALEAEIKAKDTRLLQALETEIKEIRARKKAEEEKKKILEESQAGAGTQVPEPLVEPTTKRSRRLFGFGPKTQAERQRTRVEKPLPPTG